MKLIFALILLSGAQAMADYTNGYEKRDGTYVEGYNHTHEDHTTANNYSTVGNVNPYTGSAGTVQPTSFTREPGLYQQPRNQNGY